MTDNSSRQSLSSAGGQAPRTRSLTLAHEFVLVLLPTLTILAVLLLVEVLSRQRFLFATLASSALLIYLDPFHGTNAVRTLIVSQLSAAAIGLIMYWILGAGYPSGAAAMVMTIAIMIVFNVVHPPAAGTSLSFAFRAGDESNLLIFGLAVMITALLVLLERYMLWFLARHSRYGRSMMRPP